MCDNRKEKNSPKFNMSFELFKRIGEELFPHVEEIDLRGFGESTIHPQFKSFLEYTAQFNKRILLITNLTKRDDSLWEDLVKKRVYISISLDGASKETFEKIRPGSTFETIEHNLSIIRDSRDKYDIDPWNINFLVTVQRDNIDELPEIVTLAEKYGITRIELNHIRTHIFDPKSLIYYKKEVSSSVLKMMEIAKEKGIHIIHLGNFYLKPSNNDIEEFSPPAGRIRCTHPWTNLYVCYDGKIGPCDHLISIPVVLGDLTKGSFRQEWNNKKFQRFRKYNHTLGRNIYCHWCYAHRLFT